MLSWLKNVFFGGADTEFVGRPRLVFPAGEFQRIYAIGDVHGRFDLLLDAESRIRADITPGSRNLVIFLGDYVDRGPQSAEFLAHLVKPPPDGVERVCICGNHDDAMLQFLYNPGDNLRWLKIGGMEAICSYGVDAYGLLRHDPSGALLGEEFRAAVPRDHVIFCAWHLLLPKSVILFLCMPA